MAKVSSMDVTKYKEGTQVLFNCQFFMNADRRTFTKQSDDKASFISDFGGMWKGLEILFTILATCFGHNRMVALLANQLYKDDPTNQDSFY